MDNAVSLHLCDAHAAFLMSPLRGCLACHSYVLKTDYPPIMGTYLHNITIYKSNMVALELKGECYIFFLIREQSMGPISIYITWSLHQNLCSTYSFYRITRHVKSIESCQMSKPSFNTSFKVNPPSCVPTETTKGLHHHVLHSSPSCRAIWGVLQFFLILFCLIQLWFAMRNLFTMYQYHQSTTHSMDPRAWTHTQITSRYIAYDGLVPLE